MDIVKQHKKQSLVSKWLLTVVIAVLALISVVYASQQVNKVTLSKKDLIIGTSKTGDITVTVDGYGKLVSNQQELITAMTSATVKKVLLKPGALVKKDNTIAILENPELNFNYALAKQQHIQSKANLRELILKQQRDILNEQAQIAILNASLESATLKREAEEGLVKAGIVSQLTFKQSALQEKQLTTRMSLMQTRLNNLVAMHKETQSIQQEKINQAAFRVNIAKTKLDALEIKATFDGILQRLQVQLGQSVLPGQQIALIGSTQDLIAEIKIPQSQASLVSIGQQVIINTRQDKVQGNITRIDPIVKDNTILLDISIVGNLPKSARPELNVDASIIIKTLTQVTYIARPANIRTSEQQHMYRLNAGETKAEKISVTFGDKTSKFAVIAEGIGEGERIILSDMKNYNADSISIN